MPNQIRLKATLFLVMVTLWATAGVAQKSAKARIADFESLTGSWQGSLTYLDYSSGKPYTMPADVNIRRIGQTGGFSFSNVYPKESSANEVDTLVLSDGGALVNDGLVVSRKRLKNGLLQIITTQPGKDGNDNKSATFRFTYLIGKTTFRKRKDVRLVGSREWIKRHEYVYTRK